MLFIKLYKKTRGSITAGQQITVIFRKLGKPKFRNIKENYWEIIVESHPN